MDPTYTSKTNSSWQAQPVIPPSMRWKGTNTHGGMTWRVWGRSYSSWRSANCPGRGWRLRASGTASYARSWSRRRSTLAHWHRTCRLTWSSWSRLRARWPSRPTSTKKSSASRYAKIWRIWGLPHPLLSMTGWKSWVNARVCSSGLKIWPCMTWKSWII